MELSNLPQAQRDLLDSLRDAIVAIDEEQARNVAEAIVNEEMDPNTAIRYSIAHAAVKVGEKFDSGEYYLPHLVMAGDLMDEVGVILEKNIPSGQIGGKRSSSLGRFKGTCTAWGRISLPPC